VAPVDEDRHLHRAGAAELGEGVEGGADGAAGEEHVVDEDDDLPADVDGDLGGPERLDRPEADVVAVEGDVERAHGHGHALEALDGLGQAVGDGDAPGVEADEHDVVGAVVALDDLVGDAGVGPAQRVGVEHLGPTGERSGRAPGHKKTTPVGGRGVFRLHRITRAHEILRGNLAGSPSRSPQANTRGHPSSVSMRSPSSHVSQSYIA